MKSVSGKLFAGVILFATIVVIIAAYRMLNSHFTQGMTTAVQHKSVKHSSGRIQSVTILASASASPQNTEPYRVCFLIESSLEIASDERAEYQAVLSRPFCRDIRNPTAAKLKADETLEVGYLLENDGQISIARIETSEGTIFP